MCSIDCGQSEQNARCLIEVKLKTNIKHIIQHPCEGPLDKKRKGNSHRVSE